MSALLTMKCTTCNREHSLLLLHYHRSVLFRVPNLHPSALLAAVCTLWELIRWLIDKLNPFSVLTSFWRKGGSTISPVHLRNELQLTRCNQNWIKEIVSDWQGTTSDPKERRFISYKRKLSRIEDKYKIRKKIMYNLLSDFLKPVLDVWLLFLDLRIMLLTLLWSYELEFSFQSTELYFNNRIRYRF
jgi:hypothetical protein